MSDSHDFDLIVIGAGSGGVRLARMSAQRGAKVAVVESRYLGGTCVNVGCVPKKLFVYGAHVHDELEDAAGYGWRVPLDQVSFDWPTLVANKNAEIERLNGIYGRLLENAGVEIINGTATISDANTVTVGERSYSAKHITVATGSWPVVPDVPGKDCILTSNEMFYLPQLPRHAVVWGGGYIAVEFAGILAGLGVETTLLYRGDLFLRGFDNDVRRFTEQEMRKKGVDLRFNATIESIETQGAHYQVMLSDGERLETGLVMAATGRRALVDGLGLTELGIELNASGHIVVDDHFQTSVPSITALGDVIGTPQLTPVALAQAMVLSRRLFGDGQGDMDYSAIPTAVFCQPNIGTVGLTEEEAREAGHRLRIYRSEFRPMKYTLSGRDERCLMKLVVDDETDKVLGAHMVGPDAGEIIQGLAVAIKAGATKAQFDSTMGIHPTSAEEFVTMREPVA
ncbi:MULTISPECIES: glutathione-disulfide reductase [unclassified Marinobacter]|uniref:Glutathione-disulfide reductase n=1 Tax=Marinobacter nauticus TaxID=2743 RepID=A0A455WBM0_MARNT|nr:MULTISPECIES: glutathione-disulfide reductase [unclassified Marinobacter]QFS87190.1 Glutathione amide reductase [Marinobacter sp. THAF197a]QFT50974.1 Glutathione amide reductase [Marinobacter sp. THAF39]BBJ04095.1 glutathione-disulfide reductase [Marinobacter nauticus]